MNKLLKEFNGVLQLKESIAVRDMSVIAGHIAQYNGTLSDDDNKIVECLLNKGATTLMNIKIIRSLPISFN